MTPTLEMSRSTDRIGAALKERANAPQGLTHHIGLSDRRADVDSIRRCTIDGCERRLVARGYCGAHWNRWKRTGDPLGSVPRPSVEERFWPKVQPTGFCWEWTAYLDRSGYGTFHRDGGPQYAHRVAYELLIGPVPEGLQLDHLCRNPGCVNPDHLEPVTMEENLRRGFGLVAQIARTNTCKRGHSLDDAYVRPDGGGRNCRRCIELRTRKGWTGA